ncbi:MHS family proline/betaine transporter-like MFS transporter [Rhodococcus wratislaviensis]|uniref:Putative proline/betaine transporter n=1 Tax=Rhodococcus wratislaviensis TaxID=44752 RepID=A0AB38F9D5_RHOWR|nr:MFS transporter [Rhodococcus wratislaviensis]REE71668.1 MHS family proline/betaine transporter-like MFS transporter [Rhodococcus wratislaviensis]SPZ38235.1 MFS superfamily proline/ betaine transporter [Rhodococcus wratislaviensis]
MASAHSSAEQETLPPGVLRRAIAASAMGNATEWFDYGVYAFTVSYISAAFFPGDTGSATLYALLVFAVSFVVRPLGGLVWGPLGDRLGRRQVLALTIILMAGATFCVGLVPGYDVIGFWAPLLLVLLRMIQGFSTGGEYGGAATFMAEYSPDRKRGFCGSFLEFGTLGGYALGAIVVLAVELFSSDPFMSTWGWRIPFLIAGPMGLIGLYLRTKLEETPVFRELDAEGEVESTPTHEFKDLVTEYWKPLLLLGGLVIALNVTNYTLLSYMPTYLETQIGLTSTASLSLFIVGQLVMMAVIPFAGGLSDRVGRKPLWYGSLVGLIVLAVPMYLLMRQGFGWAILAFAVLGLLYVLQLSTISATFPAMFPTHVRFAGFAIAYNVSTSLFGGTAPAVNELLIEWTGNTLMPAFYMMAACGIGLVALYFVAETAGASIRGRGIPGIDTEPHPTALAEK